MTMKAASLAFYTFSIYLTASPMTRASISVIDLNAWTERDGHSTTAKDRQVVVDEVAQACQDIGFFAIRNHGVNATAIHQAWAASRDFFDLPLETKLRAKTYNETEYPYGYENSERLTLGKKAGDSTLTPPDLKETFSLGPYNPAAGMPPRRFPAEPPKFEQALTDYYSEMEQLALLLLQLFARALELPPDWFVDKMDHHLSALRILNYFEMDPDDFQPGQLRASAHTDYGVLTILKSGGPGLQVKKDVEEDEWVDVPYLEDAFVINLGDMMQRWTNDLWVSTLHRVIIPNNTELVRRQSIAFFVNVNGDCVVDPQELVPHARSKYPPITAKQHLMAKHLASMGITADDDSNIVDKEL